MPVSNKDDFGRLKEELLKSRATLAALQPRIKALTTRRPDSSKSDKKEDPKVKPRRPANE